MTYNRNEMTVVIESYLLISLENAFVSFSEECGNISNCQLLYNITKNGILNLSKKAKQEEIIQLDSVHTVTKVKVKILNV